MGGETPRFYPTLKGEGTSNVGHLVSQKKTSGTEGLIAKEANLMGGGKRRGK